MIEGCIGGPFTGAAFFRSAMIAVTAIIASNKANAQAAIVRPVFGFPASIVPAEMPRQEYVSSKVNYVTIVV